MRRAIVIFLRLNLFGRTAIKFNFRNSRLSLNTNNLATRFCAHWQSGDECKNKNVFLHRFRSFCLFRPLKLGSWVRAEQLMGHAPGANLNYLRRLIWRDLSLHEPFVPFFSVTSNTASGTISVCGARHFTGFGRGMVEWPTKPLKSCTRHNLMLVGQVK